MPRKESPNDFGVLINSLILKIETVESQLRNLSAYQEILPITQALKVELTQAKDKFYSDISLMHHTGIDNYQYTKSLYNYAIRCEDALKFYQSKLMRSSGGSLLDKINLFINQILHKIFGMKQDINNNKIVIYQNFKDELAQIKNRTAQTVKDLDEAPIELKNNENRRIPP